eukprot:365848-Chlamydomonas_euryale.AAC.5
MHGTAAAHSPSAGGRRVGRWRIMHGAGRVVQGAWRGRRVGRSVCLGKRAARNAKEKGQHGKRAAQNHARRHARTHARTHTHTHLSGCKGGGVDCAQSTPAR